MAYADTSNFKKGQWNVICDVCGFQFKSGSIRKRWDGMMVCSQDWEHDHPQKHLRVKEESQTVPFVRNEPEPEFINVCYVWTAGAFADLGTADCSQSDNSSPSYLLLYNLKNAGAI